MKTLRVENRSQSMHVQNLVKLVAWGFLLLLAACKWIPLNEAAHKNGQSVKAEEGYGSTQSTILMTDIIVSGLIAPWSIGFLPNGNAIVAERNGRLRMVADIIGSPRLIIEPIAVVESANTPEGGLLGIAIHPDFINNRMFYLCITLPEDGLLINRIERWQLSADGKYALHESIVYSEKVPVEKPQRTPVRKGLLYAGLVH